MAAEVQAPAGFSPLRPQVWVNRCHICYWEHVPIFVNRDDDEFLSRCPQCGFEGRFPAGSRAASTVRRWTAAELRRMRRRTPFPIPGAHSSADLADEEEPMREER